MGAVLLVGESASGVPATRTITAGAGLTGGGDLSADRTIDAAANADGSIVVNANDIQVGVLATDAQHGVRGGGTQHAVAVPAGAAGFMSGADKTKIDGVAAKAAPAVFVFGNGSITSTTTTRYASPGFDPGTAQTSAVQIRCPRAGVIRDLHVRHNTGAGNGNAIVYTARKNAAAQALTVSLASTGTSASDVANSFSVAQGDTIDVEITKAASIGASPVDVTITMGFEAS